MATRFMRDILIQHIDGAVAFSLKDPRLRTFRALLDKKWLRFSAGGRATVLTQAGRVALCDMLGEYADALVAAGFDEGYGIKVKLSTFPSTPRRLPQPIPLEAPRIDDAADHALVDEFV